MNENFKKVSMSLALQLLLMETRKEHENRNKQMHLLLHSNKFLHGTRRVSLAKATKPKANPATNTVRVETRNHDLAWSQSGNNSRKTVN